jgi:hypothetical protein
MDAKLKLSLLLKVAVAAILMCAFISPLVAQTKPSPQSDDQAQQRTGQRGESGSSEWFVNTRPSSNSSNPAKARNPVRRRARTYPVPPKGQVFVKVGVTIGRGRPATDEEIKNNSIAKAQGKCLEKSEEKCVRQEAMVIERISDSTTVTNETPIQMMIEYLASQDAAGTDQVYNRIGYLYVINRVQFPNGKMSSPKLIYPTRQTYRDTGGIVQPGRLVILPGSANLWLISRNKTATQAFETYLIIVSPKPLRDSKGVELLGNNLGDGAQPLELNEKLVNDWVKWWGSGVKNQTFEEGLGKLLTKREQSSGIISRDTAPIASDLNEDDPRPQMGFYKAITPDGAMLITIKLPFKEPTAPMASKQ